MMRKGALLVAAIALAAFATTPSNSFAAAKKSKAEQSNSLTDSSQCSGGACTARAFPTYHYRSSRKKHHKS
jgi:hypothetical protein